MSKYRWVREKSYIIRRLTEDGLLKPVTSYGEEVFWLNYDTEEEAWEAIERHMGKPYVYSGNRFCVLTMFDLTAEEYDDD